MSVRLKQNSPAGYPVWTMTCVDYVNAAAKNAEEAIRSTIRKFPNKEMTTITKTYKLELDGSSSYRVSMHNISKS